MSSLCKRSCGLCGGNGGGGSNCRDARSECPRWAGAGYCVGRHEAFMTRNCRRSCRRC